MKYIAVLMLLAVAMSASADCQFNPNPPPKDHVWMCICDQNGQNCRTMAVRVK